MPSRYEILVRNQYGGIIGYIDDFISLEITDVKNDAGSWTIESHTAEQHPFEIGSGIIVYRNGAFYFSGIMEKVESVFNLESRSWQWTAEGKSDISLFEWRYVFPEMASGGTYFQSRFKTFYAGTSIINAITTLIADEMQSEIPHGIPYIGNSIVDTNTGAETFSTDVKYRFDSLLETLIGLMNEANIAVRPEWDLNQNKIHYHFYTCGKPLESGNVFYESKGHIASLKRLTEMPSFSQVVVSVNAEESTQWKYFATARNSQGPVKENFIEPNENDLAGTTLQAIAESEAAKTPYQVDGYEVEISSESDAPQYQVDYKLGDTVGIALLDGTFFSAEVTRVETEVSYGVETVHPFIGVSAKGVFSGMKTNIAGMDARMTRILKRGQA